MPRSTSRPPPAAEKPEAASGMAALPGLPALQMPPERWLQLQQRYLEEATQLWNGALGQALSTPSDRRFANPAWADAPGAPFLTQLYLLNARTLNAMAEAVETDAKTKARLQFAVQQWVDAAAPSNYLALNPEALRLALDSSGSSLAQGLQQLWADLRRGKLSQTDDAAFEVGRNVATSAGSVVFENEVFQLIEYAPLTPKVHARPFLVVPPFINKYYILDLQPENSLIRYLVEQGHRTFVMSWRNPDESCAAWTWDQLVQDGPLTALRVVREIAREKQCNALGFCVGGTILSTALAVLAARNEHPVAALTLLTTLLDFSDTGILDIFIDEHSVALREQSIGKSERPGLLKGSELAQTFSFLRPNDLVWNYVVGNYLKGEAPPAFDLLYWNGDSTNMSGPAYCWYLRHTYLQNELKAPGRLRVCGEAIDLGKIKAPVYVYGSREDHIVPWASAYASTQLLQGPSRFVLGASGHIAGVINPARKNKRSHWTGPLQPTAQAWLDSATEIPGSWWSDWSAWLQAHGGALKQAPRKPGSAQYPAIEPAPGRYVKQPA